MKRSTQITVHPKALQHNLRRAQQLAPNSHLLAVIKANAYGHGSAKTAGILHEIADAFAVSCIPEAIVLRDAYIDKQITILQGFQNDNDLRIAEQLNLRLTIHDNHQLRLLENYSSSHRFDINIKIDSGMHRLGFHPNHAEAIYSQLSKQTNVNASSLMMMTHFACADELDNNYTTDQIKVFNDACKNIDAPKSMANSAGILGWEASRSQWVRPGIMLYGSSPFSKITRDELDLKATMTVNAPVISVHSLKKGESIGYAASWACPKNMAVAVIACGYADGYPRHAKNGTPIWLNGKKTELLGRVSMDMIVVSAEAYQESPIRVGDMAELWGSKLSVDRIAADAETIAYEIMCNAGNLRFS